MEVLGQKWFFYCIVKHPFKCVISINNIIDNIFDPLNSYWVNQDPSYISNLIFLSHNRIISLLQMPFLVQDCH